ncbi:MAG: permease-like cell division protein FtsX [Chitinophagales bacterium]|nr:permease-like cell division protein FtsX [Chitinophagales bacterium]MBP6155305.1 permease-like cell division protein FtsX [Chitinophagales bacterium]
MSDELEQKAPVKRKPNFGFAIISIAMILFIIGLFSFGVFTIQKQIKEIKESVQIDLNLKADVTDAQKEALTKYLKKQKFISKISYKSKEVAAQQFEKELGQNFTEILGSNPLYDAYIISLKSDYTNPEFIQEVKSDFLAQSGVQEVQYSELAINSTSTTLKPITIGIVVLSIIMLIVAFLIIDNTIRLMMYSQRFLIRSMQLIGANEWFIIKPYLLKSIITGIISAAIAILCLIIIIYLTINKFGLQFVTQDFVILSFIALGLIIFGIIISITSTYFSVNKYLKVKLDELY